MLRSKHNPVFHTQPSVPYTAQCSKHNPVFHTQPSVPYTTQCSIHSPVFQTQPSVQFQTFLSALFLNILSLTVKRPSFTPIQYNRRNYSSACVLEVGNKNHVNTLTTSLFTTHQYSTNSIKDFKADQKQ